MKVIRIVHIVLCVLAFCTLQTSSLSSAAPKSCFIAADTTAYQPRKEKLSTFERSFKPSNYDADIMLFKKNDTARVQGTSIEYFTTVAPETVQGFRVQILATQNYEEISSVKNFLNSTFPELSMYMVFESPTYKIRVGDYANRYEAKQLLDTLFEKGYKDAWIVPDKIIKNIPPKMPAPVPIDSTSIK